MIDTKNFKTRTMFLERHNGSLPDAWPVAADFGYSSVKIFSPNICAVFPSFATPFTGEIVGTPPKEYILYRDADSGETWLVGEAAQNSVSQDEATIAEEAVFGRSRYDDPMFKVLIRTGLGIACMKNQYGEPGNRRLYVQTGLPPKYMRGDKADLTNAICGHHRFTIKVGNNPEVFFDITIDRSDISVMEQPKGTLMSVAVDNTRRFTPQSGEYFNKNVLIFDAGFGTLDIYPIRNNLVDQKQTFPDYSMRKILRRTIDRLYEMYGTEISMVGMQRCLNDGFIRVSTKFSSKKQEFGEVLDECCREVCDEALEKIGQIFKLYEYDYFIITGGTGAAWADQIREKLKDLESLHIVDGNQNDASLPFLFANVRGYYLRLFMTLSRKQAQKPEK